MLSKALVAFSVLPAVFAQTETVYGVYIYSRHGDRTPKIIGGSNLTQLGYQEVYQRGQYYRGRYIADGAPSKIQGINSNIVKLSQLAVSAPQDNVLMPSAEGWLQGLYPPFETTQTLRNGSVISAPLSGYQLIPIALSTAGTGSEDSGWLQAATGCNNAEISSNNYFLSDDYTSTLASTKDFYQSLIPVVNTTFAGNATTFKNAYTIFDYINVAEIHNTTIPSSDLLTNDTLLQLKTRANQHEWGLAYNASDNVRAISGMQLAAQIVDYLNGTINSNGSTKLGVQFGAYATFLSFFGVANLTAASGDFYGIDDYASAMIFELFSNTSTSAKPPAVDELQVRFLFHNGTSADSVDPTAYPLFGQSEVVIPWTTFTDEMGKFSVGTTEKWCTICGNSTGSCAAYSNSSSSSSSSSSGSSSGGGISKAVAGVIGAMVTLGVILGLEALIILIGGFRLVSKKRLQPSPSGSTSDAVKA